ncbi:hypothetical protein CN918_31090 [Priestia megaterium]|nr:hypothetical protein CN918_31090 [Priestia megaterium]
MKEDLNNQSSVLPGTDRETFRRMISMTGERARIDAKVHKTYIVYMKDGEMVKEYHDGRIEVMKKEN